MEYIEKHPEKHWKWHGVSENPNLTIDFIEKHLDKNWDTGNILKVLLSKNKKTESEIKEYLFN